MTHKQIEDEKKLLNDRLKVLEALHRERTWAEQTASSFSEQEKEALLEVLQEWADNGRG